MTEGHTPREVSSHVVEYGAGIVAVRADNPSALTLTGTQTYVVGTEDVVVIDPGPLDPEHLDRVDGVVAGRHVQAVCLTHSHRDHSAAAKQASERWGQLRGSPETLRRLALDGRPLADQEALELRGLTLRALTTPGHSGDHLCYLCEPSRDLFTGDLVLGEGSTIIVHPDGSVRTYLTSLARLISLHPARLMPGHASAVVDGVKRLEACRIHRIERTKHVLHAIRAGADSLDTIREAVYWGLPESHHAAAEFSIRAYLAYLREEGHEVPDVADSLSRRRT